MPGYRGSALSAPGLRLGSPGLDLSSLCASLGQKRGRDHSPSALVLEKVRRREDVSVVPFNVK